MHNRNTPDALSSIWSENETIELVFESQRSDEAESLKFATGAAAWVTMAEVPHRKGHGDNGSWVVVIAGVLFAVTHCTGRLTPCVCVG